LRGKKRRRSLAKGAGGGKHAGHRAGLVTATAASPLGRLIFITEENMNNLNSILIEGNLTRDPEFQETAKGTALCTFSIASSRFFKQDNETEKEVSYFDVQTWVKNHFLYSLFSGDLELIFKDIENYLSFLDNFGSYLGDEKEEYFDILEACLDMIEDLYFSD
jgi:hypothetical protein